MRKVNEKIYLGKTEFIHQDALIVSDMGSIIVPKVAKTLQWLGTNREEAAKAEDLFHEALSLRADITQFPDFEALSHEAQNQLKTIVKAWRQI